jgi:hypothetical protein
MKKFFLLFFAVAICKAAPRTQFNCTVWNTKGQVPSEFRILEDYNTKESFIQFGDEKEAKKNPMAAITKSANGPTVNYQNNKVWVGLMNKGGTAGRWDGDIRYNNKGKYYDGNDSVYDVFCEIK